MNGIRFEVFSFPEEVVPNILEPGTNILVPDKTEERSLLRVHFFFNADQLKQVGIIVHMCLGLYSFILIKRDSTV